MLLFKTQPVSGMELELVWLASEPQGSTRLCLFRTKIAPQLFCGASGALISGSCSHP